MHTEIRRWNLTNRSPLNAGVWQQNTPRQNRTWQSQTVARSRSATCELGSGPAPSPWSHNTLSQHQASHSAWVRQLEGLVPQEREAAVFKLAVGRVDVTLQRPSVRRSLRFLVAARSVRTRHRTAGAKAARAANILFARLHAVPPGRTTRHVRAERRTTRVHKAGPGIQSPPHPHDLRQHCRSSAWERNRRRGNVHRWRHQTLGKKRTSHSACKCIYSSAHLADCGSVPPDW